MTTTDLTVAILSDIRDEIRTLSAKTDVTNARLESLESTTDHRLESLESKADVTNARLGIIETTLVDFGTQVVFAGRLVKNVERRHDAELADLRDRVTKLERDE